MSRQKRHLPQGGRAGGARESWISLAPELKTRDRMGITSTRSWAFVALTPCSKNKDYTNLLREHVRTQDHERTATTAFQRKVRNDPKPIATPLRPPKTKAKRSELVTELRRRTLHRRLVGAALRGKSRLLRRGSCLLAVLVCARTELLTPAAALIRLLLILYI
jgi:hypothetical protein